MRIEWLPKAARDFDRQIDFIAERNLAAAITMGDAIEEAVSRLAGFPESARLGRVAGTRELVIAGTPFIAVYRIERQSVVILRLMHGAQIWPPG